MVAADTTLDEQPAGVQRVRPKRSVVLEAVQWDGTIEHGRKIAAWAATRRKQFPRSQPRMIPVYVSESWGHAGGRTGPALIVRTAEGKVACLPCDWVVSGVHGEFFRLKPRDFEATYEPVR